MSQENNSVTRATEKQNEKLRTMTRTMTTSALVSIDTIAPFDMGGNSLLHRLHHRLHRCLHRRLLRLTVGGLVGVVHRW
jgi:hypothetical protein